MKKKPNLFVVGAPKCGTTFLYQYLKKHPDIYFPNFKEPHYFGSDLKRKNDAYNITLEDYLELSHIHISNRKTGMGHVDMTLYKLGLTRDIYLRAQHFLVAPYIVAQSDMAITTTKGFAVDRNLAWRELPFDIDPLVLHLYWHENNDNESSSKWMRDLMLKTYGKLQQVS